MKYKDIQALCDAQFRRLTGIKWSTFNLMVEELSRHHSTKGRPFKLSDEDQLLLSLEYWREYRTLFHIGMSYGISEPSASRIVRRVEDILIKSDKFHLPKKVLQSAAVDWDVVVIDATEIPIQRPKKNRKNHIVAKRNDTP